tara:strand:+ start:40 stop:678 length:639 start_codon:yes stop_codon:yes gene_type:complete
MTPREKQPININIKSDNDVDKTSIKDTFKDYIIETNMQLREENLRLREEINQANNTISEIEQEQDRYDNRVRYMKGLLNNLVIIKNNYIKVYNLEKTNHKQTSKSIHDFTKIIEKFNQELSISQLFVYISACIMGFTSNYYTIIVLVKFSIMVFWFYKSGLIGITFYKTYNSQFKSLEYLLNKDNQKIIEMIKQTQELERETISLDYWVSEI